MNIYITIKSKIIFWTFFYLPPKTKSSWGLFFSINILCRASVHFFHQLSILERAMDHKCNNNCNCPEEMCVGFKCNGLIVFSQRGGNSKSLQHMRSPPTPPPPLLGSPPPRPPSSVVVGWNILWLWCSDRGVLPNEGWSVSCDRVIVISDGSEPWENPAGAQESGDVQRRPCPPPPAP
jgi:hypothetical protein